MRKFSRFVAVSTSLLLSTGLTGGTAFASPTVAPTLTSPAANGLVPSTLTLSYDLPETPSPNSVTVRLIRTSPATPSFTRTMNMSNDTSVNLSLNVFAAPSTIIAQNPTKILGITPTSELLPIGIYTVSVTYQNSSGGSAVTTSNSLVTFTYPCEAGTYSTNGYVPVGNSCTQAPANTYVATTGATSATPCPTSYSSPAGSDELTDCVAPVVTTTPTTVKASPSMTKGQKRSLKSIAIEIGMNVPAKAKVTGTLDKASKKLCKVSGAKLKANKSGSCNLKLKVKPKKGAATKQSTTITVS